MASPHGFPRMVSLVRHTRLFALLGAGILAVSLLSRRHRGSPPATETRPASLVPADGSEGHRSTVAVPPAGEHDHRRTAPVAEVSSQPTGLRILCQTPDGLPVRDASVDVWSSISSESEHETSDQRGEVRVETHAGVWQEVFARHEAAGSAHAWIPCETRELALTLHPATWIRGRVVRADGLALDRRVTVVAVPKRLFFANDEYALLARPDVLSACCEPDGSFLIPSVSAGTEYSLAAGGQGLISQPISSLWLPGTAAVEIELYHLYGAVVDLETEDLAELRTALSEPRALVTILPEGMRAPPPTSVSAFLAGYPTPDSLPPPSSAHRVWLAGSASDENHEPLMVRGSMSGRGFFPLEFRVPLISTRAGSLLPIAVPVSKMAGFDGEIAVIDRTGCLIPRTPRGGQWAELHLDPVGGGRSLSLRLPESADGVATARGIPPGSYEARIERRPGGAIYPPGEPLALQVGKSASVLEVRCEECPVGSVEIAVAQADGDSYLGSLTLRLTQTVEWTTRRARGTEIPVRRLRDVEHVMFARAPYRVDGLEAGDWFFEIENPRMLRASGNATIVAGETSRLLLRAGDDPWPARRMGASQGPARGRR